MIDKRLLQFLGVDSATLFLNNIEVVRFGSEIIFKMLQLTSIETHPKIFQIKLWGCVHQEWQINFETFDPPGSESRYGADIIGIALGMKNYEDDFTITSDELILNVRYDTLEIVWDSVQTV